MKRARIDHLHVVAQNRRAGFLEACQAAGRLSHDGRWLIFTDQAHAQIRKRHNPNPPPPRKVRFIQNGKGRVRASVRRFVSIPFVNQAANKIGLGDLIHKIAGPVGRAIHWPCMKGDGTTDLKAGSPCSKLRAAANKVKV